MTLPQPELWAALERLNARARRIDHEAEVDYVLAQAEADSSLDSRGGIIVALPDGSVANLLGLYDTVTLGRRIDGKDKTLARYEVIARVGTSPEKTIIALCS